MSRSWRRWSMPIVSKPAMASTTKIEMVAINPEELELANTMPPINTSRLKPIHSAKANRSRELILSPGNEPLSYKDLAMPGIAVRDCTSFGLPDRRDGCVAVPSMRGLAFQHDHAGAPEARVRPRSKRPAGYSAPGGAHADTCFTARRSATSSLFHVATNCGPAEVIRARRDTRIATFSPATYTSTSPVIPPSPAPSWIAARNIAQAITGRQIEMQRHYRAMIER